MTKIKAWAVGFKKLNGEKVICTPTLCHFNHLEILESRERARKLGKGYQVWEVEIIIKPRQKTKK
jgi:hypothetical protein